MSLPESGERSMRSQRLAAALLLALALPCSGLHAELLFRSAVQENGEQRWSPGRKYIDPQDTAYERQSAGRAPAEEVRVFLSGEITRADVDSAEVMARLLRSGKQKLADNTVWLASNGGDMDAAMHLGRLLRELGAFTFIGKDDQCLSACAFAFMGGERRRVAGLLGIHRPFLPYTQNVPDRQLRFRHMQRVVQAYIEEMDFPASLYEAVMLVPPETIKMLSTADLQRFYLEGISPSSEDLADAGSARRLGLSMADYLKYKATAPACVVLAGDQARCDGKAQAAASGGAAGSGAGDAQGASASRATARKAPESL